MSAPDISRERCELRARFADEKTGELILALRAALTAAERERDEARSQLSDVLAENDALRFTLNNARFSDATGYARGVRESAGAIESEFKDAAARLLLRFPASARREASIDFLRDVAEEGAALILALLPASTETKETRDDQ